MAIGHAFIELESVDSTNNYAMAQVQAGSASHGMQIFAYEQWAGKGQRGRGWASQPGDNIILSTILQPVNLPITRQFALSMAIALACHDLFSKYAGAEDTRIKWPNDLYWRDRKAGGILIENSFRGEQWAYAVAGTGININQTRFPETARNPVSLKQITGKDFRPVELARELGGHLENRYGQFASGRYAELLNEYNARLFRRHQSVRLRKDNAVFETVVQEVSETGMLITRDSVTREFGFGDVEWII